MARRCMHAGTVPMCLERAGGACLVAAFCLGALSALLAPPAGLLVLLDERTPELTSYHGFIPELT